MSSIKTDRFQLSMSLSAASSSGATGRNRHSSFTHSMSPATIEARVVCDKLFENLQLLIQYMDFPNLAPFVLRHKLMTGEEYGRLTGLWGERHLQEAIIEFLLTVRHKPDWGRKLITALEDSVTQHSDGSIHLGHVYILRELKECKAHFASGLEKVTSELESLLHSVDTYSSLRNRHTVGLLTTYLPLIMQYTDIDIILPFLKVSRMLTDEDYQQLKKMWLSSQRREAIETLLFVMSRKCPEWEDCFVSALHQSLHSEYGDYHEGHKHILEILFNGDDEELNQPRLRRASCHCDCHQYTETLPAEISSEEAAASASRKAALEFRQNATETIQGLFKDLDMCLKTLESTHTVNVKWLRDVSAQLESLSTICSTMMDKCQHKRIQQGIKKSLGQLEIGASAFESQVDRHSRKYADKNQKGNDFVIRPSWVDFKELNDQMHNLEEYILELLEWTDTAFAILYPHDDLIFIREWGRVQ